MIADNDNIFTQTIRNTPFATKSFIFVFVILFLLQILVDVPQTINICVLPYDILFGEIWRLLTASFFHLDLLHLVFNTISFHTIGSQIESSLGSTKFIYLCLIPFSILCNLLATVLLLILGTIDVSMASTCSAGFSAVIFSLLCFQSVIQPSYKLFGYFTISSKLYPWILLVLLQILLPKVSFIGHLCGIIMGHLYVWGYLKYVTPSQSFFRSLDEKSSLKWIQSKSLSSFVNTPDFDVFEGAASSSTPSLPLPIWQGSSSSTQTSSTPSSTTEEPRTSTGSSSMPFSGKGYVLGSANTSS
eukprot:TRINITY_DN11339_c0_g1_i1.p1 TRINITY_DN11339_c0_g1~~TRINITY_DN11339_c0_g1_i1.p1  ORF type:complete len:301 (-),score=51.05 TRINITY_DN11339_c0_g1_i1:55-957(-)